MQLSNRPISLLTFYNYTQQYAGLEAKNRPIDALSV